MKIIAITTSIQGKDYRINTKYIEAFSSKKMFPILISPLIEEITEFTTKEQEIQQQDKAKEIAKISDALILTGGSDINPIIYGKTNHNSVSCNLLRDKSDLLLIEAFINEKKPIMGICRGMQLLGLTFKLPNFKQSLHEIEELHNSTENELSTRQEFAHSIETHGNLEKYLIENQITTQKEINVNSSHHQGFTFLERKEGKIRTIDKEKERQEINQTTELNILANTKRVIEAFEHKHLPIFAVQWHPEEYGNKSVIINYFINKYLK